MIYLGLSFVITKCESTSPQLDDVFQLQVLRMLILVRVYVPFDPVYTNTLLAAYVFRNQESALAYMLTLRTA